MTKLVDSISDCKDAVDVLLSEEEIVVDIEGVKLSRTGQICLIQIFAPTTEQTFLFDIEVLKQSAFTEGGLKDLLQDTHVLKILFDVRADTDALFHLHGVYVNNVYDLQVLYDLKFSHPMDTKLVGLGKVMTDYFEMSKIIGNEQIRELEDLKERGRGLFIPDLGGSYEVWKKRPLSQDLQDYAAADVKYLFRMKKFWSACNADSGVDLTAKLDEEVKKISLQRMLTFIGMVEGDEGLLQDQKRFRDFDIPQGFNTTGQVYELVPVPKNKRGKVIGRQGATIKGIQSRSGARASFHDEKGGILVFGTRSQVQEAVMEIEAVMD